MSDRPPSPRRSLARRLALTLALTGLGAALLTALLVNVAFQSRFDSFVAQQQQVREEQLLAVVTATYTDAGGWDEQALAALAPAAVMSGAEVSVYDNQERLVFSTADSAMGADMGQQHREMMGVGQPRQLPVVVDGQQVGILEVAVPQGDLPSGEQDFLDSVNLLLIGGAALAGLVAVAAGVLLARRATRPVAELTAAARGLAAGQRARRAHVHRDDELGELATAFNALADTVEREDQVRRLFAADVAHELRTPLAILRSQLEAVQDGLHEPTPAVLASLHEETLRLGRLVADLEAMTSADAAGFHLELRPIRLDELIRDVTEGLQDRFTGAGLTLTTTLQPVTVSADPDRLTQVLTNLLRNAVKFVPATGRVNVTLDQVEGMARLRVIDDGPGSNLRISRTSSTASTGAGGPEPAGPAWAWPSSTNSSARTVGRSAPRPHRAAAPPSPCAFRYSHRIRTPPSFHLHIRCLPSLTWNPQEPQQTASRSDDPEAKDGACQCPRRRSSGRRNRLGRHGCGLE